MSLVMAIVEWITGFWPLLEPAVEYTPFLALGLLILFIIRSRKEFRKSFEGMSIWEGLALILLLVMGSSFLFAGTHGCSQTGDCEDKLTTARNYVESGDFIPATPSPSSGLDSYWTDHGVLALMSVLILIFGTSYILPAYFASFLGVLNVLIAFLLGTEIRDWELGLFSAALFATSEFLIIWAKDIELYSAVITFLLLSSLSLIMYTRRNETPSLLGISVLSSALAVMIRIEAIFFVPILLVYLFMERTRWDWRHLPLLLLLLLALPTATGDILFEYGHYTSGVDSTSISDTGGLSIDFLGTLPIILSRVFLDYNSLLVLPLFIVGALSSLIDRNRKEKFLLIFFIAFQILLTIAAAVHMQYGTGSGFNSSRFLQPLQIPVLMMAALGVRNLLEELENLIGGKEIIILAFAGLLTVSLLVTSPNIRPKSQPSNEEIISYSQEIPERCTVVAVRPSVVKVHKDFNVIDISRDETFHFSMIDKKVREGCVYLWVDKFCIQDTPGFEGVENCDEVMERYETEEVKSFDNGHRILRLVGKQP